jgi:protein SCO1/2
MRIFAFTILSLLAPTLFAAESIPYELKDVSITEHLGDPIDLNLAFTDEAGATVPLKTYFDGRRPVVMTLAYYGCPNLCGLLLNGITATYKDMSWMPGQEFEYVNVSIDPTEKPELAAAKKENLLKDYGRPEAAKGWHFLVGDDKNIHALAQQMGFSYYYDKDQKQYAHGSAAFVLTPDGKLSRYLFGVTFAPRDMRLGLLEASRGKIGNIVDHILLYCYRYDPKSRKYSLIAIRLLQIAAGVTIVALAGGILLMRRRSHA